MKKFFQNKTNVIIVAVLAAVLVVVAVVGFVFLGKGKSITIPDLTGKTVTEVEEWANQNGIGEDQLSFEYIYSETVESGKVAYHSPKADEELLSNLVCYVSLGADPNADITIPEVNDDLMIGDVKSWAEKNGMTNVTVQYLYKKGETEGKVLYILDENLNKISGTCKRDTILYVVVACGTNPEDITVEVPNLVGLTIKDVNKWGTASMISIKYLYEYSDKEIGTVLAQSVKEGTKLKGGSEITITVSVGKGVTIADLANKTKAEAQKYCDDNYLKVAFKEASSDKVAKGKVISTDPKAGTLVKYNSVLNVVISSGKASTEVTVPDNLLGTKEADFVKKINSLGLKVAKQELTFFSTTLAKGTIYAYDSGKFNKGAIINYALSEGSFFEYLDSTGCKDFNGITQAEAEKLMEVQNARNAHGAISFNKEASSTVPAGETYNCKARMDSGIAVSVTCTVSENSTAKIMNKAHYDWVYRSGELKGQSMADYLKQTLKPFTNLNVVYEYNTSLSEGQVSKIEVDGKDVTTSIPDGGQTFPVTSKVVITLATSVTK